MNSYNRLPDYGLDQTATSTRINQATLSLIQEAVLVTDSVGIVRSASAGLGRIFGINARDFVGRSINELVPESLVRRYGTSAKSLFAELSDSSATKQPKGIQRRISGRDVRGNKLSLDLSMQCIEADAEQLYVVVLSDVSFISKLNAEISQFKSTLEFIQDSVFLFDGESCRCIYANQAAVERTHRQRSELHRLYSHDLFSSFTSQSFDACVSGLRDGSVKRLKFLGDLKTKDNSTVPIKISLEYLAPDGENARYVAICSDMSQELSHGKTLEKLMFFDPLTNLPNRVSAVNLLAGAIESTQSKNLVGAAVVVDLDEFRKVNDLSGYCVGDAVIKELASNLNFFAETLGTLSRIGGDQFLLVAPDLSLAKSDATSKLDDIIKEVLKIVALSNTALQGRSISACVGAALFSDTAIKPESLLQQAELALHDAKSRGKGKTAIFTDQIKLRFEQSELILHDLRLALASDCQLLPYFQPKVDADGSWTGFEALARWHHPSLGVISPDVFIPLAEAHGLIEELGAVILQKSVSAMARWRATYPIGDWKLAVNVSPVQLKQDAFPSLVRQSLSASGLSSDVLKMEITESMLASDVESTVAQLNKLHDIGVSISLDDFGTGYSSLSYLKTLPIDELKIDRSFLDGLESCSESRVILESILTLAHKLNLSTLVEGVETKAQFDIVRELQPRRFQGYFFSKPLPEQMVVEHLARIFEGHSKDD